MSLRQEIVDYGFLLMWLGWAAGCWYGLGKLAALIPWTFISAPIVGLSWVAIWIYGILASLALIGLAVTLRNR